MIPQTTTQVERLGKYEVTKFEEFDESRYRTTYHFSYDDGVRIDTVLGGNLASRFGTVIPALKIPSLKKSVLKLVNVYVAFGCGIRIDCIPKKYSTLEIITDKMINAETAGKELNQMLK